jgi:phosphatidylglycerophosphate synthase
VTAPRWFAASGAAVTDPLSTSERRAYAPTSRRPIAEVFRAATRPAVRWCVRAGVHPDVISYGSILASVLAGIGFAYSRRWPVLLLISPLFLFVRLWFNMLDGMVALEGGKASLRGEILNDLPDRISDVIIFAGVAHSGLCHLASGYWAAIFALMTAYVGLFGQAVGVRREFSGIMSKPWRMVALAAGAWITLAIIRFNEGRITLAQLTVLDWTCLLIVAGCIQTIWIRLARTMRGLRGKG